MKDTPWGVLVGIYGIELYNEKPMKYMYILWLIHGQWHDLSITLNIKNYNITVWKLDYI